MFDLGLLCWGVLLLVSEKKTLRKQEMIAYLDTGECSSRKLVRVSSCIFCLRVRSIDQTLDFVVNGD